MTECRLHIEILEEESGQIREVDLESVDGVVSVGRDRGCRIVLNAPSVSRQHCKFLPLGDSWSIIDDGSTLGTSVNGQKLEASQARTLEAGDVVACPGHELRIHVMSVTDPTLQPDPDALGRLLRAAGEESAAPARIWVFAGGDPTFEDLPQEGMSLTVGRSGECDIQIADPFKVVSAVHAKIERNWAGVFLYDASTNGVFVNRQQVREETKLQDGDRITIAMAEESTDRPLLVYTEEGNAETPLGIGVYVASKDPGAVSAGAGASPESGVLTPGGALPDAVVSGAAVSPGERAGKHSSELSGGRSSGHTDEHSDEFSDTLSDKHPDRSPGGLSVNPSDSQPEVDDSLIAAARARGGKTSGLLILVLVVSALALATVFVWGVLLLR